MTQLVRTALAYSDGSFNVHPEGWPIEKAIAERDESDRGVEKPEQLTKIVRVRLEIFEENIVPLKQVTVGCKWAQLIIAVNAMFWLILFLAVANAKPTLAPMGHTGLCLRHPDMCAVHAGKIGTLAQLQSVNLRINRSIKPDADILAQQQKIGRDVDWQILPSSGVCHDYAVTKQAELLRIGWPSDALRLAVVRVSSGEYHLILLVQDRWVLDNLFGEVMPIERSPHRIIKTQRRDNPLFWETWQTEGDDR